MSQLTKEIKNYTQNAWLDQPRDIETMLQFNRETGRNFVVVLYLNGFLDNMTILLYDYYLRAKQKEGDFEALKSLTAGQLRDIGNSFKSDYHMYDSHTLLLRAACEAYEVKNFEELTELLQTVQQYLVRLFYWADFCMPWKEMCEAYEKVTGK